MAVKVLIPTPLQKLTMQEREVVIPCSAISKVVKDSEGVEVEARSISGLIETLETQFPGIRERLCDEKGKVRRFINIFVNEEDIRFLEGELTKIEDGDEISIIPAIAGG